MSRAGFADLGGVGDERDRLGAAYREQLTETDLRTLVRAEEVPTTEARARVSALRRAPSLILDVLEQPATSATLLNLATARSAELSFVSPFLVFAAAVHRTAGDLAATSYTPERATPRLRVPVFDADRLRSYLDDRWHRLFLAELLTSFARTRSGVMFVRTRRGVRRRRWNDLDPNRLAAVLDSVPASQRAGVWRRLGDLALFLAGVFPDARSLAGVSDPGRLARRTGLPTPPSLDLRDPELLEWLGAGWYRLAAQHSGAPAAGRVLHDAAEHVHHARRVLNATADRYLFPLSSEWFGGPR